jgi:nitrate/nitrite transporter NarK
VHLNHALSIIIFVPSFYVWLILSIIILPLPVFGIYATKKVLFDHNLSKGKIFLTIIGIVLVIAIYDLLFGFLADKSYPLNYDAHNHLYLRLFPFM